jgi:sulfofructose kinase
MALTALHREYGMRVAAMTLGDEGALALYENNWFYSAAFDVRCVDTTGAGDVFHGAFCYAMLSGMGMQDALDFSNAAAALNCTDIGARGHIPYAAEIENLISAARTGTVRRREAVHFAERCAIKTSPASAAAR